MPRGTSILRIHQQKGRENERADCCLRFKWPNIICGEGEPIFAGLEFELSVLFICSYFSYQGPHLLLKLQKEGITT